MNKITLKSFLNIFIPHHCYFCGKIGASICDACLAKIEINHDIIKNQHNYIKYEFYISDREGIMKKIVDDYKFHNRRDNSCILAKILIVSITRY